MNGVFSSPDLGMGKRIACKILERRIGGLIPFVGMGK
jgi:hypothetical protein